jgi:chemotaxis protein histidine kinase CheA
MTPRNIAGYNSLFLKTAKEHIQELERLLFSTTNQPNIKEVFRHVHSLKGSSQMMGYENIAALCTEIISNIRPKNTIIEANRENIESIEKLVKELKNQIQMMSEKIGETIS